VSIGDVRLQRATVSGLPGVYVIYREIPDPVEFLDKSTGGWFKGRNPSVPIETLEAAWVHDAHVLYVGKADAGQSGRRGIRARFDEYLRFGMGQPTGHWGGRYVWQLAGTDELMICFKPCTDPRDEETRLLGLFRAEHGSLPFAIYVPDLSGHEDIPHKIRIPHEFVRYGRIVSYPPTHAANLSFTDSFSVT